MPLPEGQAVLGRHSLTIHYELPREYVISASELGERATLDTVTMHQIVGATPYHAKRSRRRTINLRRNAGCASLNGITASRLAAIIVYLQLHEAYAIPFSMR